MTINANPSYNATQLTATTTLKTSDGAMGGIFVSAASSTPTITVYNNTAASGTKLIDTFTPTSSTFYPLEATFNTGLTVAIGGTVSCTVLWL